MLSNAEQVRPILRTIVSRAQHPEQIGCRGGPGSVADGDLLRAALAVRARRTQRTRTFEGYTQRFQTAGDRAQRQSNHVQITAVDRVDRGEGVVLDRVAA